MNIFKNHTFTWLQLGAFKLSVACLGIAVGAYWSTFFLQYLTALLVLGVLFGIYVSVVYFRQ